MKVMIHIILFLIGKGFEIIKNMRENQMKEQMLKKSELNIQDAYDYGRITMRREHLIPCSLQEEDEDIILQFDMDGLKPLSDIRQAKEENKLLLLMDAMQLDGLMREYQFELGPNNLFYDENFKIWVLMRDVYPQGEEANEEEKLKKEKALCAYVLQNKYSYEDYYEGGMKMLKRSKFLKEIYEKSDTGQIRECLQQKRQKILTDKEKHILEVRKSSYLTKSVMAVIFPIFVIGLIGFGVFYYETIGKVRYIMLAADNCYIAGDLISMIDEMEHLTIDQMDLEHKFILAQAYIRSEDLTAEQKENILASFNLTSNEKIMEYWIHIGRLEVQEAENIAMQYSDNELLLYAYMKDKALTETNTVMDGTEKQQKLADLEDKIEGLAEPYTQEEE